MWCSTLVMCIEPPLPPMRPPARPNSSAYRPAIDVPRASAWLWPRSVAHVQSSPRIAAAKPAATASWPTPRWVVPRTRPSKNSSWARDSNRRHSAIVRYIARRVWRSAAGAAAREVAMATSVGVGDEQLLGREARDHLGAVGRDDDLLLDPRRREPVRRRAVRLEGDDHPLLQLDR